MREIRQTLEPIKINTIHEKFNFTEQESKKYNSNKSDIEMNTCLEHLKMEFNSEQTNQFAELERKEYNIQHLIKLRKQVKMKLKTEEEIDFDEQKSNGSNKLFNKMSQPLEDVKLEYNIEDTIDCNGKDLKKFDLVPSVNQFSQPLNELKCNEDTPLESNEKKKSQINCTYSESKSETDHTYSVEVINQPLKIEYKTNNFNEHESEEYDCKNLVNKLNQDLIQSFKCIKCNFQTEMKNKLNIHLKIKHGDGKKNNVKPIRKENNILASKKQSPCSKLECKNSLKCFINRHRSNHSRNDIFNCKKCAYTSNSCSNFKRHAVIHSREYHCKDCKYKTYYNSNFKDHLSKHSGEYQFSCTDCEFKTNRRNNFKRHVLKHSEDYRFHCADCGFKTHYNNKFELHLNKHSEKCKYNCMMCDHKTNVIDVFKRHISKHAGEMTFQCTDCEYKTYNSYYLKIHIKKHAGEYKFHCTNCDYKTIHNKDFKDHISSHSGKYKFNCTACEYKTNRSDNFKRHICKHSEKYLLHCTECDFKTSLKRLLFKHKLKHNV